MKLKELTKVETYKGIDLFYNKENGRILFNLEGQDLDVKYVFEAEQIIDYPNWEECDLRGYFIDGVFKDFIGKAIAVRKNIKDGKPEWKYMGEYDSDYKLPNHRNGEKVFLLTKENSLVYAEFEKQQANVLREEIKLKEIISQLK